MVVGKDHVIQYRTIFLEAIGWYSKDLEENLAESKKRLLMYFQNSDFNLLTDLKKRIEDRNEVSEGKMNNLLGIVVGEYYHHLLRLKEESWVKEDTIKIQLDQITEITSKGIVKVKK